MTAPLPPPQSISQDLLDRSGRAYLTGDADDFTACFSIPHTIRTFEGVNVISDKAGLLSVFHAMRAYFYDNGVTDIVRTCIQADYVGPDTIIATHESRFLSGHRLIQRPSVAMSTLRRTDNLWRVTEGQYAVQDAADHVTALISPRSHQQVGD